MSSIGPVEIIVVAITCLVVLVPIAALVGLGIWLVRRSQKNALQPASVTSAAPVIDPSERLKSLQKMLADGLISQEEFDAKRAEIVKTI